MEKQYMLFVDGMQIAAMLVEVERMLTAAIEARDKGRIIALTGLRQQLTHPVERKPKNRPWWKLAQEQVMGK